MRGILLLAVAALLVVPATEARTLNRTVAAGDLFVTWVSSRECWGGTTLVVVQVDWTDGSGWIRIENPSIWLCPSEVYAIPPGGCTQTWQDGIRCVGSGRCLILIPGTDTARDLWYYYQPDCTDLKGYATVVEVDR